LNLFPVLLGGTEGGPAPKINKVHKNIYSRTKAKPGAGLRFFKKFFVAPLP